CFFCTFPHILFFPWVNYVCAIIIFHVLICATKLLKLHSSTLAFILVSLLFWVTEADWIIFFVFTLMFFRLTSLVGENNYFYLFFNLGSSEVKLLRSDFVDSFTSKFA
ncbi:hypothetical protein ACJX0J_030214, partial [Zea mays]